MPRTGRVVLANYPHHVIQRGHNRGVVFPDDADCRRYIGDLRELKSEFGVRVYAYCLMSNHVHLLVAPGDDTDGLARLMKALAARATRYRNRLEGRTGTLWEGRYKSSLVETDSYLLACCRYIELNPVRENMVVDPAEYAWSSYRQRLGLDGDFWIDRDPCYLELGETEPDRRARYAEFVGASIPDREWQFIGESVERGQLTGTERFTGQVGEIIGRRVERRRPGRPRKAAGVGE